MTAHGTNTATNVIRTHLVPVMLRRAVIARLVGGESLHLVAEFGKPSSFISPVSMSPRSSFWISKRLQAIEQAVQQHAGRRSLDPKQQQQGQWSCSLANPQSEDGSSRSSEYRFQMHGLSFVNQEFESYNKRSACQLILFTTSAPNSG